MKKRPLFIVVLFFGFGILIGRHAHWPMTLLAGLTAVSLSASLIFRKQNFLSCVFIFLSFFLLGILAIENSRFISHDHIARVAKYYRKNPIRIHGIVASDVQTYSFANRKKTTFELQVQRIQTPWGWKEKRGKILVNIFRPHDISYDDEVFLEGKLHRPFEWGEDTAFSYRDYLENRGIQFILSVKKDSEVARVGSGRGHLVQSLSFKTKEKFKNIFSTYLSANEAGLMQALILGGRSGIPKHINQLFIQTGTAHILAVSGFNVGIVAFFSFLILKMFPVTRKAQYIAVIFLLVGYAFLTGLKPPVVRATVMAIIFIVSFILERETDAVNTLALAAFALLTANPNNLFDVGFQLSFISVFFIVILYGPVLGWILGLSKNFSRQPFLFLWQSFSVSLVAWLGVAGCLAYYFHIVTPVTVVANLIVIPLFSLIVILGLGLLLAGGVPFLAVSFAACLKGLLNVTVISIYIFNQVPLAYFYVRASFGWVLGYYAVISVGIFVLFRLLKLTNKSKYDTVTA